MSYAQGPQRPGASPENPVKLMVPLLLILLFAYDASPSAKECRIRGYMTGKMSEQLRDGQTSLDKLRSEAAGATGRQKTRMKFAVKQLGTLHSDAIEDAAYATSNCADDWF